MTPPRRSDESSPLSRLWPGVPRGHPPDHMMKSGLNEGLKDSI